MSKLYFKTQIPFNFFLNKLEENKLSNVNFFIDFLSFNRSAFSERTVISECEDKFQTKFLIKDLCDYLNEVYLTFQHFHPKFVLFFDTGGSKQNKDIYSDYKANRGDPLDWLVNNGKITKEQKEFYKLVKQQYITLFPKYFNVKNISTVICTDNFEGDFIAHYCIRDNLLKNNGLNVILSGDKDLLQSCKFDNTYQIMLSYDSVNKVNKINIFDKNNATQQLIKDNTRCNLTAEYVPLLLSMGGDDSDNIPNIEKIKYKKAYDLILNNNLSPIMINNELFIEETYPHLKDMLITNYKLTSFDEQIERLPEALLENIKSLINTYLVN